MPWVEVFAVFVVSHLVGDYVLQTEWQASNKHGGLRGTSTQRRALVSHVLGYTIAYVPAMIWLWDSLHGGVFGIAALVALPHLVQDDGTLLNAYSIKFKQADLRENPMLGAALDQSFHIVALFGAALVAGG